MAYDQDIADIRARVAKAESDRDDWRSSGSKGKYYEAYFLVNALELELDRLRKQRLRGERYAHELDVAVELPRPIPTFIRRASLS